MSNVFTGWVTDQDFLHFSLLSRGTPPPLGPVNPDELADFEAVFGRDALRARSEKSDRRSESAARKLGGTLPDMRRGDKPSAVGPKGDWKRTPRTFRTVPVDPSDSAGDWWTGPRAGLSDLDKPGSLSRPKARDRFREPTASVQGYGRALTREEYEGELAKLDAENEAALAAARAAREVEQVGVRAILPADLPQRLQDTAAAVREWAARSSLRTGAKPVNVDVTTTEDPCECCGAIPCRYEPVDRDELDGLATDPTEVDDEYYEATLDLADSDLEDVPAWALDDNGRPAQWWIEEQAKEQAEMERQAQEAHNALMRLIEHAERESSTRQDNGGWVSATEFFGGAPTPKNSEMQPSAEDRPSGDLCSHCEVDPVQTKRDGLCRPCKTYRSKHAGQLPPPRVVNLRRARRTT